MGFVGSTPIAEYVYTRGCASGKRVQCFGGAKNHMIVMPDADMDQAVDALIGAGYGSAGERCMAVSVAVPVGQKTADILVEKLIPRVESLKIGPSTSADADFGPLVTAAHVEKVKGYVDIGIKEGAKLKVDGREDFKMQGYENGFYMGGCLFDDVKAAMRIYKEEIFGPVLSVVRAKDYNEALRLPNDHEYGNGVAIFTRDGDAARDFAARVQCRHGGRERADPRAARLLHVRRLEALRLRRPQPARPELHALLHQDQDGHLPLAERCQGGRGVRHPDDAVSTRSIPRVFLQQLVLVIEDQIVDPATAFGAHDLEPALADADVAACAALRIHGSLQAGRLISGQRWRGQRLGSHAHAKQRCGGEQGAHNEPP